jgi:hypothetical protein
MHAGELGEVLRVQEGVLIHAFRIARRVGDQSRRNIPLLVFPCPTLSGSTYMSLPRALDAYKRPASDPLAGSLIRKQAEDWRLRRRAGVCIAKRVGGADQLTMPGLGYGAAVQTALRAWRKQATGL